MTPKIVYVDTYSQNPLAPVAAKKQYRKESGLPLSLVVMIPRPRAWACENKIVCKTRLVLRRIWVKELLIAVIQENASDKMC